LREVGLRDDGFPREPEDGFRDEGLAVDGFPRLRDDEEREPSAMTTC
jgi:hypothetical protein